MTFSDFLRDHQYSILRDLTRIMLTIFAAPKPFLGKIKTIQENAIKSWTELHPKCEIILFGDEVGISDIVTELKIHHEPKVLKNEYGTPLINDIFNKAKNKAVHNYLCYINSDIILLDDFLPAFLRVKKKIAEFLIAGQRWDIDIDVPLTFEPLWESHLIQKVYEEGKLRGIAAMDYFIFNRSLWNDMPPFAVGRPSWDNWMIYKARKLKIPVINATQCISAIHQNHNYDHIVSRTIPPHRHTAESIKYGPESFKNKELAGDHDIRFNLYDATHILTRDNLRLSLNLKYMWRFINMVPILYRYPENRLVKKIFQISHNLWCRYIS